jgi:hypothetical protein
MLVRENGQLKRLGETSDYDADLTSMKDRRRSQPAALFKEVSEKLRGGPQAKVAPPRSSVCSRNGPVLVTCLEPSIAPNPGEARPGVSTVMEISSAAGAFA